MKWIRGKSRRAAMVIAWAPVFSCALNAASAPVQNDSAGRYTDEFFDSAGLSFEQNVKVGPTLTPGARVSPGNWQWVQPRAEAADAVGSRFSDPASRLSLTEVVPVASSATGPLDSEWVGLWMREYRPCDMELGPAVISTTIPEGGHVFSRDCHAKYGPLADLNGSYYMRGPYQSGLASLKDYTVTFRLKYCDDPNCDVPAMVTGAELGVLDVAFGATQAAFLPVKFGGYDSVPQGDFMANGKSGEGLLSPVTLEWRVPNPLPPGNGWEYRLWVTLTTTGGPACAPTYSCNATIWMDSITVMAKGREIVESPCSFRTGPCPPGTVPCRCDCIPAGLACGWDASTEYSDSGSYLSPVFDSLSDKTIWNLMVWDVEQNYSQGWPRTPVSLKWRVGNDPDPSTWKGQPNWFNCAVVFTVTCTNEAINCESTSPACGGGPCGCAGVGPRPLSVFPCMPGVMPGGLPPYPLPMKDQDNATPYSDCDHTPAVGRYFQYEMDFTSQFANGRYPPERDNSPVASFRGREFHDVYRPLLKSMRVYYKPARGRVISRTITPAQLKRWKSVVYTVDLETGGSVQVDVLDVNNIPLFSNIPSGFDLAGLSAGTYPSLRLRATVDNLGDGFRRPSIRSWGLEWENYSEPLQVNCNSISLSQSQRCTIIVALPGARQGSLLIHDASGDLIRELHRGDFPGGTPSQYVWDGTNERGMRVAPGVYFLTLRAKEIKRSVRIAVVP